jgi:hypothetical protein
MRCGFWKPFGFQSGQLTRIRRQRKAEYRKAVELAAQKNTNEAFAQLERMGAVTEFPGDQLHDSAAQSYLKALEQNQSALLVAPTWNEIEAVTEKVRAALKTSGRLAVTKRSFKFLIRCRGRKRRNGMRGNTVPAWRFGFTGKKLVLPKMKRCGGRRRK